MASHVMKGYQTPPGVNDAQAVRDMQRALGVKADGVWGPQTQKAYEMQYAGKGQYEKIPRLSDTHFPVAKGQYAKMPGLSDPYFPGGKQYTGYGTDVRERRVADEAGSAAAGIEKIIRERTAGKKQYENMLGISDPYFSDGDPYMAYAKYLNSLKEEPEAPDAAADMAQLVWERTKGVQTPEWMGKVSSMLPGAGAAAQDLYAMQNSGTNADEILDRLRNETLTKGISPSLTYIDPM